MPKPDFCQDRADWLVDAIACSTQNRMFLQGDKEADQVVIEAVYLNGLQAIRASYEAGLDEAVDIIAETCRVRLFNITDANTYIANIESEKEAKHE